MHAYGIDDGDLIVIDRTLRPHDGSIVVAIINSEFTVKALHLSDNRFQLNDDDASSTCSTPEENQPLEIWGVATSCIKRLA